MLLPNIVLDDELTFRMVTNSFSYSLRSLYQLLVTIFIHDFHSFTKHQKQTSLLSSCIWASFCAIAADDPPAAPPVRGPCAAPPTVRELCAAGRPSPDAPPLEVPPFLAGPPAVGLLKFPFERAGFLAV